MPGPVLVPSPDKLGDANLVARVRLGDRYCEETLYRRHASYVVDLITRLAGKEDEAEDIAHDAFLIAFDKIATLRDTAAFRAWLAQIAVSLLRRRWRRQSLLRRLGIGGVDDGPVLASQAAEDTGPEVRAELAGIERVLTRLPPADRLAWMLRRVEGFQMDQVAQSCACSLTTAKRRVAAADRVIFRHTRPEEYPP